MSDPAKASANEALIRSLANLLNDTGLTEIEIEDDDVRVRVARGPSIVTGGPAAAYVNAAPHLGGQASASLPSSGFENHPGVITSPMVGTAYLSPEPGTASFVEIGSPVREGQTLVIVEAMKTMNQITAPRAGSVKRILIENGQPVEYGEPLMVIE